MIVATLRLSLRLHGCRSLKEKRRPRRMLTDSLRSRFGVAVAEVADQDTWDLLTLGVAAVGPERAPVEATLQRVADYVAERGVGELVAEELSFMRP